MSTPAFVAVLNYAVVPYTMQTQRSKHGNPRAKRYNDQQVEMQDELMKWALLQKDVKYPISSPVTIDFIAYYKTRHKRDMTNVRKAVEDALVGAGIIEDDNANIVVGSNMNRVFLGMAHDVVYVHVNNYAGFADAEFDFILNTKGLP